MRKQIVIIFIFLAIAIVLDACIATKSGSSGNSQRRDMRDRSRDRRDGRSSQMRSGAIEVITIEDRV